MGRQKLLDNIEWDKVGDFESSVHTAIVDLDTLKALVNEFKPLVDEREGFYHGKYDSNKELGYDFKHIEMLQYYYCGCMHDCCGHKTPN